MRLTDPCATTNSVDDVLDENAILDRIRAHLGGDVMQSPPPAAAANDLEVDVAALREAQDIYERPLRSHRRALGPALLFANRALRKLLKPSLERQVSYNAANERLVRALLAEMESLKQAQAALEKRCDALQSELTALRDSGRGG
jgi:hypothetical protein